MNVDDFAYEIGPRRKEARRSMLERQRSLLHVGSMSFPRLMEASDLSQDRFLRMKIRRGSTPTPTRAGGLKRSYGVVDPAQVSSSPERPSSPSLSIHSINLKKTSSIAAIKMVPTDSSSRSTRGSGNTTTSSLLLRSAQINRSRSTFIHSPSLASLASSISMGRDVSVDPAVSMTIGSATITNFQHVQDVDPRNEGDESVDNLLNAIRSPRPQASGFFDGSQFRTRKNAMSGCVADLEEKALMTERKSRTSKAVKAVEKGKKRYSDGSVKDPISASMMRGNGTAKSFYGMENAQFRSIGELEEGMGRMHLAGARSEKRRRIQV
ncbi:hypothetical protein BT69DRAFT_325254 [Atractiella rhizophila]|nr:hypothetical protein BT69DRAFT_325254 [Atractiella rhizophila]